jgi:hypothetical protein
MRPLLELSTYLHDEEETMEFTQQNCMTSTESLRPTHKLKMPRTAALRVDPLRLWPQVEDGNSTPEAHRPLAPPIS